MTSLPYFNLYVTDEAADTAHLTAEEHGAYHRLRCAYWRHNGLPDDDERLRRLTGIEPARWPAVRIVVASLFQEGWRLPKLDEHRTRAEADHAKKVKAGKEGARKRWGEDGSANGGTNGSAIGNAMPSANGGPNSHQHQMKNSALEEGTSTHTPTPAREAIPRTSDRLVAGRWLTEHADLFPGDPGFNGKVDRLVAGTLTWQDIRGAAA